MSESSMRATVVLTLKLFHAVAVENPAFPGTPDVNCSLGWIELKELGDWPDIDGSAPVLISHYTPQQRIWLAKRWKAQRGGSWLLLKVAQQWLLFRGDVAAERVGRAGRDELQKISTGNWQTGVAMKENICWSLRID